jgi:hypothetical protein
LKRDGPHEVPFRSSKIRFLRIEKSKNHLDVRRGRVQFEGLTRSRSGFAQLAPLQCCSGLL